MEKSIQVLELLTSYVKQAEELFQKLAPYFERPRIEQFEHKEVLRHQNKDGKLACYLKLARAISAMNAVRVLLPQGYFQECGVLCRTIADFCDEVAFLLGDADESHAAKVQSFLVDFYQDIYMMGAKARESNQRSNGVPKRTLYAASGRSMQRLGISDPYTYQQTCLHINDFFSSYAHGAYPLITEMYSESGELCTSGLESSVRFEEWVDQFNLMTHKVLISIVHLVLVIAADPLGKPAILLLKSFEEQQDSLWCC